MSESIESDLNLDLHFLPSWAKEPSNRNLYADFEGERERRGDRPRDDRPGRRREGPPSRDRQGPRPQGDRSRPGPQRREGERGDRGPRGDDTRGRPFREARPEPPVEPWPEVDVILRADEKGVDSLARQIRMTGRAYPLFEVAQMVLAKPERHTVTFSVKKNAEGQAVQPLFVCALDDTVWLSEDEAVDYVLNKHFNTFYQAERTAIEPPKGTYTFVAQCGLSGTILGPPNHHDYQNQLRKLHSERFSRMPFEVYKSRVRIVRDEPVIQKWVESQSWRIEYVCLNMPEPLRLASRAEVEQHFRENHLPIIIKQVESHTLSGLTSRNLRCQPLQRFVRFVWEQQRRFPLQIATVLSQQFAAHGLQFFKVNKNITYVAVARPHYLELEATPVSEGIQRIVIFINAHPRCTRRQLMEALAPAPVSPPAAPAPVETVPPAEAAPLAEAASEPGAETPVTPPPAAAPEARPEPSPEANVVISDLHWLIHQGHVIEFADGVLETAKRPLPKPVKPARPVPAAAPAAAQPSAPEAAAESAPQIPGEVAVPMPEESRAPEAVAEELPAAEVPDAAATETLPNESPAADPAPSEADAKPEAPVQ